MPGSNSGSDKIWELYAQHHQSLFNASSIKPKRDSSTSFIPIKKALVVARTRGQSTSVAFAEGDEKDALPLRGASRPDGSAGKFVGASGSHPRAIWIWVTYVTQSFATLLQSILTTKGLNSKIFDDVWIFDCLRGYGLLSQAYPYLSHICSDASSLKNVIGKHIPLKGSRTASMKVHLPPRTKSTHVKSFASLRITIGAVAPQSSHAHLPLNFPRHKLFQSFVYMHGLSNALDATRAKLGGETVHKRKAEQEATHRKADLKASTAKLENVRSAHEHDVRKKKTRSGGGCAASGSSLALKAPTTTTLKSNATEKVLKVLGAVERHGASRAAPIPRRFHLWIHLDSNNLENSVENSDPRESCSPNSRNLMKCFECFKASWSNDYTYGQVTFSSCEFPHGFSLFVKDSHRTSFKHHSIFVEPMHKVQCFWLQLITLCRSRLLIIMSSLGNQRRHKADTGGPSNMRDRRSHLSDDVLVKYEKFASYERTRHQGGRIAASHRDEVMGSSTSGRTEARSDQRESTTSRDHSKSEEVVPGAEGMDDHYLLVSEELQVRTGGSLFPYFEITREDMVDLVHTFHFPMGHKPQSKYKQTNFEMGIM
ncbi:hypothetical protein ACOSQ2_027079 [Xanthoceras sorbifolium]